MKPIGTKLAFTYKKEDSDVWVLNFEDIPVDKSKIRDQQIVHLAPGSIGGNHKHPRTEWFVALGDLTVHWLDEDGVRHELPMNPDGQLLLIEIPPHLPHAVQNTSSQSAVLFELADGKMIDKETITVL